jgi:HAD superfamily hydrolase (TIGR01662 family)
MSLPIVTFVMGFPASGKSTLTAGLAAKGFQVLNRDTDGGSMSGLLKRFQASLVGDAKIVLDNTFCTVEDRDPFIEAALKVGVTPDCVWLTTSAEDAQINALHRMWDRYGQVFLDAQAIKAHPKAAKDPNIFPAAAIFAYRKGFEEPTVGEGFARVEKVPFQRRPYVGTQKALILDYDGTLRRDAKEVGGAYHYPVNKSQVEVLPNRREVLQRYLDQGYLLLGVSTQSGIAKGHLTDDIAVECFQETNRQLGHTILHTHCKHGSFPVGCYCRKPQAGLGVHLTRLHNLDPSQCIFVGDLGTDRTFAARCGFQFADADTFFK